MAVVNEQVEMIRLLANKKELLNIKNENGRTPLDIAKNSPSQVQKQLARTLKRPEPSDVKYKMIASMLEQASK